MLSDRDDLGWGAAMLGLGWLWLLLPMWVDYARNPARTLNWSVDSIPLSSRLPTLFPFLLVNVILGRVLWVGMLLPKGRGSSRFRFFSFDQVYLFGEHIIVWWLLVWGAFSLALGAWFEPDRAMTQALAATAPLMSWDLYNWWTATARDDVSSTTLSCLFYGQTNGTFEENIVTEELSHASDFLSFRN